MPRLIVRPTARDVAQLAGVSPATVSYVLSGRSNGVDRIRDRISEATRARILKAGKQLNYVPNHAARSLRRQRTERICLVLPVLGAPYFDALADELNRAADAHNYSMIIAVGSSAEREAHILSQLRRHLADGAVFISPSHISKKDLAQLARSGLAVLAVSNQMSGRGFDVVRTTEGEACFQAVKYLLDAGHRRIAFLGHCTNASSYAERLDGYCRALQTHGIAPNELRVAHHISIAREAAYHDAVALLQREPRPTAIMAASDIAAIGAISAAHELGLRVPDDVAVIGVGNIREGEMIRPALTTVGPAELTFTHVSQMLFSRLRGEASRARIIEESWQLIIRKSA